MRFHRDMHEDIEISIVLVCVIIEVEGMLKRQKVGNMGNFDNFGLFFESTPFEDYHSEAF